MSRPVTLFTGQWADLKLADLAKKAKKFGYDGLELPCWGDHFDVDQALTDKNYIKNKWKLLSDNGLECYAISNHLVGQCVCDLIDGRHQGIIPPAVWGDGKPEGVRQRAAEEMKRTARAARLFFDAAPASVKKKLNRVVVNGFTGSSIWPYVYSFPPVSDAMIDAGYADFAKRWIPILDEFEKQDVYFALEVHPTEIAFDAYSFQRAIEAVKGHQRFGSNFDPSHFGYQGVDYAGFILEFGARIFHCHMKDVRWNQKSGTRAGVFGGHANFGNVSRFWDFASLGRGNICFESIIRNLNRVGYQGPLSVEWEDSGMDREHGAAEACAFVRRMDFPPSAMAFDAVFDKSKQ